MSQETTILERLKQGVAVKDLSPADVAVVDTLRADGNYIELSSTDDEIKELIEDAVPFVFAVQFEDNKKRLTISPEPCPKSVFDGMNEDERKEYFERNKSFTLPDNTVLTLY